MDIFSLERYAILIATCLLQVTMAIAIDKPRDKDETTPVEWRQTAERLMELNEIRSQEAFRELTELLNAASSPISNMTDQQGLNPKTRHLTVQMLLRAIAVVNKNIDQGFDPNDVPYENIAPGGHYRSGIAPEEITEPEIRQKYEAAIHENNQKAERYNIQHGLRELLDRYPEKNIYPFLHLQYDEAKAPDKQELEQLLKEEIKDDKLREQLTKGLAEFRKHHLPGSLARRANE
jgi:hypothetical protein